MVAWGLGVGTWIDLQIGREPFFGDKSILGNSLVVQWLGPSAFTAGAWVQSLYRGLRSHMLSGKAK